MRFTEEMWSRTDSLQETILNMPFNRDLAAGTLRRDIFQHYIVQDAHYLEGFGRALSLAAARAPDAEACPCPLKLDHLLLSIFDGKGLSYGKEEIF